MTERGLAEYSSDSLPCWQHPAKGPQSKHPRRLCRLPCLPGHRWQQPRTQVRLTGWWPQRPSRPPFPPKKQPPLSKKPHTHPVSLLAVRFTDRELKVGLWVQACQFLPGNPVDPYPSGTSHQTQLQSREQVFTAQLSSRVQVWGPGALGLAGRSRLVPVWSGSSGFIYSGRCFFRMGGGKWPDTYPRPTQTAQFLLAMNPTTPLPLTGTGSSREGGSESSRNGGGRVELGWVRGLAGGPGVWSGRSVWLLWVKSLTTWDGGEGLGFPNPGPDREQGFLYDSNGAVESSWVSDGLSGVEWRGSWSNAWWDARRQCWSFYQSCKCTNIHSTSINSIMVTSTLSDKVEVSTGPTIFGSVEYECLYI